MSMSRRHIVVSGLVQGVYYRAHAVEAGQRLGLRGWVRNLPSGHVEAEVEGDESAVQAFVEWCHQGSPQAQVSDVVCEARPYTGEFTEFNVRR